MLGRLRSGALAGHVWFGFRSAGQRREVVGQMVRANWGPIASWVRPSAKNSATSREAKWSLHYDGGRGPRQHNPGTAGARRRGSRRTEDDWDETGVPAGAAGDVGAAAGARPTSRRGFAQHSEAAGPREASCITRCAVVLMPLHTTSKLRVVTVSMNGFRWNRSDRSRNHVSPWARLLDAFQRI